MMQPCCWTPPFEPEPDVWKRWLRQAATAPVIREIASADWGYRAEVEAAIRDLMLNFAPTRTPKFEVRECLELVSNHEYQDNSGTDTCMFVAGAICLALESAGVGYFALGMPGRLARTTFAAIRRGRQTRLAYMHLMAWCATHASPDSECPQSYFAASVLCLAVLDRMWNPKPTRSVSTPFESDDRVESLAEDVARLFADESAYFVGADAVDAADSLEALDSIYGGSGVWSLCIESVVDETSERMPVTRRVLRRLME